MVTLARRLRTLRERHWPRLTITQRQLADALGVSVPLISSWENVNRPVLPPAERLSAYAAFFATRRSVDGEPYRLVPEDQLSPPERVLRTQLEAELLGLRAAVQDGSQSSRRSEPAGREARDEPAQSRPWHLADQHRITLVCAEQPAELRDKTPLADPSNTDYTLLYRYSDLDALFELHGHIRASNPDSEVVLRGASELQADDYTSHIVLIGGVDWNAATRNLLHRLDVPVTQVSRDDGPEGASFQTRIDDRLHRFRPEVRTVGEQERVIEDVAHFFRGPNPFNRKRTVTVCNGMYSRGVLGAVRTLTDRRFRDRNATYLAERFAGSGSYSVLFRVTIVDNNVMTPDWTAPGTVLHEWPEDTP